MQQYLLQNNFNSGILSDSLSDRTDLDRFSSSMKECVNMRIQSGGSLSKRTGLQYIAHSKSSINENVILVPYSPKSGIHYVLEFGHFYVRFFHNKEQILSYGVPMELVTPWSNEDILFLKYASQDGQLYIVTGSHWPYILKKIDSEPDGEWSLERQVLDGPYGKSFKDSFKLRWSGGTGEANTDSPIVLQNGETFFQESDVGRSIQVFYGTVTDAEQRIDNSRYHSFLIKEVLSSTEIVGTWIRPAINSENSWPATIDSSSCVISLFGEEVTTRDILGYEEYHAVGFPAAMSFFEQRLVYGGAIGKPQTIYGSSLNQSEYAEGGSSFDTFYKFLDRQQQADDLSYSYKLAASSISRIKWMVSSSVLVIGTTYEEWRIGSIDTFEPVTPNSVMARRESDYGSSNLQGFLFGSEIIFSNNVSDTLLGSSFDIKTYSFDGISLNAFTVDLLESKAVDMNASLERNKRVFVTLGDGNIAVLNYIKSQEVMGWSSLSTHGDFKCTAHIRSSDITIDDNETWVIVQRQNSGGTFCSVEVFDSEINPDRSLKSYSDSCIKYNGALTSTIHGLSHLEGQEVVVLADGEVKPVATVLDGRIELSKPANKVIVGLKYEAFIKTLDFAPIFSKSYYSPTQSGVGLGRRIVSSNILFKDTLNAKAGVSMDALSLIPFRSTYDLTENAMPLFSGRKQIDVADDMDENSQLIILSDTPTPMMIKAVGVLIDQQD